MKKNTKTNHITERGRRRRRRRNKVHASVCVQKSSLDWVVRPLRMRCSFRPLSAMCIRLFSNAIYKVQTKFIRNIVRCKTYAKCSNIGSADTVNFATHKSPADTVSLSSSHSNEWTNDRERLLRFVPKMFEHKKSYQWCENRYWPPLNILMCICYCCFASTTVRFVPLFCPDHRLKWIGWLENVAEIIWLPDFLEMCMRTTNLKRFYSI